MSIFNGKVLDGKYELLRLLGEGGMGAVYEARHTLIGRRFAVKFLHSQYTDKADVVVRFHREAQAAAAIGHDNIIEVTDMGTADDGTPFLVMEYLDGCDVGQLLKKQRSLSVERTAFIMVQALSALQSAHRAEIIHRDLKPENIYLIEKSNRKDFVKLLDFGISKFRSLETDGLTGLTQTGTVLGTPYYMSPEQASGDMNIGPQSDIYSMGVILYQMVTGALPFDGPNYNALLVKILTGTPPDPRALNPELPEEIADIINVAMAKDPSNRFGSCVEFRNRLLPFIDRASARFLPMETNSGFTPLRRTQPKKGARYFTPMEMTRSAIVSVKKNRKPLALGATAAIAALFLGILMFSVLKPKEPPIKLSSVTLKPQSIQNTGLLSHETDNGAQISDIKANTKPQELTLKIRTVPNDSQITIDDLVVSAPFSGIVVKDDKLHTITITADGYLPITKKVKFNDNHTFDLTLASEPQVEENMERRKRHKKGRRRGARKNRHDTSSPNGQGDNGNTKDDVKHVPVSDKPEEDIRGIDVEDPWAPTQKKTIRTISQYEE